MDITLICTAVDIGMSYTTSIPVSNPHYTTIIKKDLDSFAVDEIVVNDDSEHMCTILLDPLAASHVCGCPVVLSEVPNDPIFVLKQPVSNLAQVKFQKLVDNRFEKDCKWTNKALVPAPVSKVTLKVAVSKSAQPNKGK